MVFWKAPDAEDYDGTNLSSPDGRNFEGRLDLSSFAGRTLVYYLACKTGDRVLYLPAGAPDSVFTLIDAAPESEQARSRPAPASRRKLPAPAFSAPPRRQRRKQRGSRAKRLPGHRASSMPTISAWITAIRGTAWPSKRAPGCPICQPAGRGRGCPRSPRLQRRSPSREPLLPRGRSSPLRIRIHHRPVGAAGPGLRLGAKAFDIHVFTLATQQVARLQRHRLADPVGRVALRRIGRARPHQGPDLESHLRFRRG